MTNDLLEQDLPVDSPQPEAKPFSELTEVERAELIPAQIFDLKKDEPAFLFSVDNLRTIKRYENAVRQLPASQEALKETADFEALGIDVAYVWDFYDSLIKHANSWDRVEDACKSMGSDLQVFAENIIEEGTNFLDEMKQTQAWNPAGGTTLDDVAVEMLPIIPMEAADISTFKGGVDNYLASILEDITYQLRLIRQVKALIDRFGDDIDESLKPKAYSLIAYLEEHDASSQISELSRQLRALDEQIETKTSLYDGMVGSTFTGIVFGVLGLGITGGIYGSLAEKIRNEKNLLITQRNDLINAQAAVKSGLANFQHLKTEVLDIDFRLVEVRAAAKNLEDVWVLLESYAKSSLNKVDSVSTNVDLKRFVSQFGRVISPWKNILGISRHISIIFNEVIQERN